MTKECYLKAKKIIEHDENYPASHISFAYEQIEKWEFANQRVLEELEEVLSYIEEDGLYALKGLKERIKELKQE